MKTDRLTFRSAEGTTDISAVLWYDDAAEPWAILQIVHGMQEYKERYEPFAAWLVSQGVWVCSHDHLGHGASVTSEENLGYMTADHPSDVLVEDMHRFRKLIEPRRPALPYFMLGHSMGSFLLRKYLVSYAEGLEGAIIMGTGQNPELMAKLGIALTSQAARRHGWHYRSRQIQNLTYDRYYKQYDVTGTDHARTWLTRNQEIADAYYADPKCNYLFTLSGHKALFEAVAFCASRKNNAAIRKDLPMLLISGEEDPVGGLGRNVDKVRKLLEETGHTDVTMKLYPGDRHEILNEPDREQVYRDICDWLRSKAG